MAKYYAHKPSWRGGPSRGSTATPPILEMNRQPSGGYSFSGRSYTPDLNRGASVPAAGRKWGNTALTPVQQRARLMGNITRFGMGGSAAARLAIEALGAAQNWDQADWDNFMGSGNLPAPFDWLNPPEGLFPNQPPGPVTQQRKGAPSATFWSPGPYYGLPVPFDGAETGLGYSFSRSVLERIIAHNPSPIAVWNPWYFGQAGGARNTSDLLANLGVVGSGNQYGWNFHEVYGFFGQSPIGAALRLTVGDGRIPWKFTWTSEIYTSTISAADALAHSADIPLVSVSYVKHPTTGVITKTQAAPVAVAPAYSPVPWTWAQVDAANLLKQIVGRQVRDEVAEDDWLGAQPGGKTIIPPKGPILTVPGEPLPHPPGVGTKERKARVGLGLLSVAQKMFHAITEYGDAVDALFDAIPKKYRCKTKSLVGKSWCVFMHLDRVDIGDAIVNLAWNQFEDYVLGTALFGTNAKAAKARGDRYAFRTQNSINGFGGIDDLGELYGEFSQKYVNPRKEDMKRFLTEKFGI